MQIKYAQEQNIFTCCEEDEKWRRKQEKLEIKKKISFEETATWLTKHT